MNQDILKFLKLSGILIPVVLVCYVILVVIFGEFMPNHFRNNLKFNKADVGFVDVRFKDITNFQNVDILFLGSSRSYRHYDTRFFQEKGIKSFNLGTGGMTFFQAEILLHRHMEWLNPKLIIFDVYPSMMGSDGVESSIKLINHSKPDKYFLNVLWRHKNIKVFNSFIFSLYRNLIYERVDYDDYTRGEHTYISGGFVESKIQKSRTISNDTLSFNIRDFQLKSFFKIKEFLERKKTPVIYIQSPIHSKEIYEQEDKFNLIFNDNYLNYFDFNNLDFLNDTLHFYDSHHLNQDGVEIFNNYIFEKILEKNNGTE